MEKVLSVTQIAILILGNFLKEKLTGKEYIHGKMEKSMMGSGTMDSNKDMVFGKVLIMIHT
jgi:hypothetical protein